MGNAETPIFRISMVQKETGNNYFHGTPERIRYKKEKFGH